MDNFIALNFEAVGSSRRDFLAILKVIVFETMFHASRCASHEENETRKWIQISRAFHGAVAWRI